MFFEAFIVYVLSSTALIVNLLKVLIIFKVITWCLKTSSFSPRATLKGSKRSFVVVVVVGVETCVKNGTNRTKHVHEQNLFQMEQKLFQREQNMFAMKIAPNLT